MSYKVTIITICFNNPEELLKTCLSVDAQTRAPFEHLVIDGSNKNDIRTWLEGQPQPSYRRWICERDKGIADAFNKGVQHSRGELVQFLNSGDTYFDATSLSIVLDGFAPGNGAAWCHGKMEMIRGGQTVIIGKPFEKSKVYRGMRGTFHPTMFVPRSFFERYGGFDTQLKIAMDYDFLLRIAGEPVQFINTPLVRFDPGGVSTNNYLASLRENRLCYEKYYGSSGWLWLWQLRLKVLHYLLHSPVGHFLYRLKKGLKLENV
jgi:glycosyltransferase involved in cell wall biosynthesis